MYPKSTGKTCLLCLNTRTNVIDLYGEFGQKRQIIDILKKYFWFLTISAEKDASLLCSGCWLKIETFHDFYQMVEEIHKKPIEQVNTDTWANDNPENLNIKVEPEQISFNDVDDDDAVDDINSHIADTKQDADSSDHGSNGDLLGETDFADTHFWDASSSDNEQNIFAESNDDDDDYVDDRPKPKSKKKSKKEKIEEKGTFICDICKRTFGTLKGLKYHMSQVHAKSSKDNVKCDICSRVLKNADCLRKHVRRLHDGVAPKKKERKHMCDVCAKVYTSRSGLEKHLESHTDIQATRAQCNLCQKWFKSATYVREHIKRIHDCVHQPTACPHCGKMKPHERSLKRHILECHTEPAHKCSFCDKSFVYPNFLKEHIATHTGESLYTCWYCPFPFKNKSNMYKHMKRKHKLEYSVDRTEKLLKTKA